MSGEFMEALEDSEQMSVAVTGRVTGRQISNPVWFVHEGDKIYLLPVRGSDTSWFNNVRATPTVRLTANTSSVIAPAEPVTDRIRTREIVEKFRAKYGADQIRRYYSKLDVAVEVSVPALCVAAEAVTDSAIGN